MSPAEREPPWGIRLFVIVTGSATALFIARYKAEMSESLSSLTGRPVHDPLEL